MECSICATPYKSLYPESREIQEMCDCSRYAFAVKVISDFPPNENDPSKVEINKEKAKIKKRYISIRRKMELWEAMSVAKAEWLKGYFNWE